MNTDRSPRLVEHPCSAHEMAVVLEHLLEHAGFRRPGVDPLRDALVHIAARYGEIVTQCLNAAPDLHLKAFAELLGGHARPAEAARVHLSFTPAAGSARAANDAAASRAWDGTEAVVVPMNTRVAAAPAEGDTEPVVFETQSDLELVRATPKRALFADAGHRRVANVDTMLSERGIDGCPLASATPAIYALHMSQRAALGALGLRQVKVHVDVQEAGSIESASQLEWVVPTPEGDLPLVVKADMTGGLARTGEVVLVPPANWPAGSVDGIDSLWLTLRLNRAHAVAPLAARWRPPRLSALGISALAATDPQPAVAAYSDSAPLDISQDFFPFGERPRFGSAFQVLCPAFGDPEAKVELLVRLTNPEAASVPPIPPVSREGRPVVVWEISTTSGFQPLAADDGTCSLTQDGSLLFTVPLEVAPLTIAGKFEPWLRARLVSGHYGSANATDGTAIAVVRAPAIRSLAVRSTLERGPLAPEHLVSQLASRHAPGGVLVSKRMDPRIPLPMDAFPSPDVDGAALYIGLEAGGGALRADEGTFKRRRVMSWHVRPAVPTPPLVLDVPAPRSAAPRWQMRCSDGWRDIAMCDGSAGLTRSGIVELKLPDDEPARWQGLAWLRVVWPLERRPCALPAIPIGLAINSVAARQSQRLRNEVVGSSNGQGAQVFKALRTPIVGDVLLQVREAGDDWVTWQKVEDLSDSRALSRHFTLDRSTGELRFGDGRFGRIPVRGANNIRLREYATGGGCRGNLPIRAIAQMRSAVPAVQSVTNLEPATGGLDADDAARVRDHTSTWLRHRDRAICADDFVDLALRASPEVARAFCVARRNLGIAVPAGALEPSPDAGVVSVMVLPHGTDPRPQPNLDLLATIKSYLDPRRPPMGRVVIVGPTYARVAVTMRVAAKAGSSLDEVEVECKRQIAQFLHPLTGGSEGRGWNLGQRPHRSDLYGLLSTIDGIDMVSGLSIAIGAPMGRFFVVSAGAIEIAPCE